jgi:hypothetical protein
MEITKVIESQGSLTRRSALLSLTAVCATSILATRAVAQDSNAQRALRAMSDYLQKATSISASFDSTIEVVTPSLEKIQFASSGKLALERPNRLKVQRTGGYADATFIFDGKTFAVFEKDRNIFAQGSLPGTIDDLLNHLMKDAGIEPPAADLFKANAYDALMESVTDGRQIGVGVISGIECDHFAFRGEEVDWQIWIESGSAPAPRKYVITNKAVSGAPEYTIVFREWGTGAQFAPETFTFSPPEGARKIALAELSGIDEVPPAAVNGGKK